jgi:hypothetical protein
MRHQVPANIIAGALLFGCVISATASSVNTTPRLAYQATDSMKALQDTKGRSVAV